MLLKKYLIFAFLFSSIFAFDVHVNIHNATTNSSGQVDQLSIIDLSKGMFEIGNQSNIEGSTIFKDINTSVENLLISGMLNGVRYTSRVTNDNAHYHADIEVYDSTTEFAGVTVSVPYLVYYVFEDQVYIQKRLVFRNESNPPKTINAPDAVRLHLPAEGDNIDYLTVKSGTMPIKMVSQKTDDGQIVNTALKPGVTEVDFAYYVPYNQDGISIAEKFYYNMDHIHVFVSPAKTEIKNDRLALISVDDAEDFAAYSISSAEKGDVLMLDIKGNGFSHEQMHNTESQASSNQGRIFTDSRKVLSTASLTTIFITVLLLIIIVMSFINSKDDSFNDKERQLKQLRSELLTALKACDSVTEAKIIRKRLSKIYESLDALNAL